jgi:hypothetical protein
VVPPRIARAPTVLQRSSMRCRAGLTMSKFATNVHCAREGDVDISELCRLNYATDCWFRLRRQCVHLEKVSRVRTRSRTLRCLAEFWSVCDTDARTAFRRPRQSGPSMLDRQMHQDRGSTRVSLRSRMLGIGSFCTRVRRNGGGREHRIQSSDKLWRPRFARWIARQLTWSHRPASSGSMNTEYGLVGCARIWCSFPIDGDGTMPIGPRCFESGRRVPLPQRCPSTLGTITARRFTVFRDNSVEVDGGDEVDRWALGHTGKRSLRRSCAQLFLCPDYSPRRTAGPECRGCKSHVPCWSNHDSIARVAPRMAEPLLANTTMSLRAQRLR